MRAILIRAQINLFLQKCSQSDQNSTEPCPHYHCGCCCRRTSSPCPSHPTGHQHNLLSDNFQSFSGAWARRYLTWSHFWPEVWNFNFIAEGRRALQPRLLCLGGNTITLEIHTTRFHSWHRYALRRLTTVLIFLVRTRQLDEVWIFYLMRANITHKVKKKWSFQMWHVLKVCEEICYLICILPYNFEYYSIFSWCIPPFPALSWSRL